MGKLTRRDFVIGGTSALTITAGACMCTKTGRATITGIGATQQINPDAYDVEDNILKIHLDKEPKLMTPGGAVKVRDEKIADTLIVVRQSEDVFIAASINCTHRGVEVEYQPDEQCFKCASLGSSKFAVDGEKIKGFARKPLKTYPAELKQDILVVDMS